MSRLTTPSAESLSPRCQQAFTDLTGQERASPVYRQIGNSEAALFAYLQMEQALRDGALTAFDIEVVKLHCSAQNRCEFCVTNHRRKALEAGMSEAVVDALSAGLPSGEPRVDTLVACVDSLKQPGVQSEAQMAALRALGYSDAMLVDLALAVATIGFTNAFNHLNHT